VPLVEVVDQGSVRFLTLADPDRRNALSWNMLHDLMAAIRDGQQQGTRALVLTATPVNGVWSSGHDISELPTGDRDPLTWDNPLEAALRAVRDAPFPVIAAVDGSVWGGACDLVITCDLIVATRSATFAITPARLGIPYNTAGVAHFLSALPVHIAKEMFFTSDPIDASRASGLGMINRLVENREQMESAAAELSTRIANLAPMAIEAIKAEISALSDARHLSSEEFEKLNTLRTRAWRSHDYQEGLTAFHERRAAEFEGR